MDSRKIVFRESGMIAVGVGLCVAAMMGIFMLLGGFDRSVLLGGILGWGMAVGNFLFMAIGTCLAADRAQTGNVRDGQAVLKGSFLIRYSVLFLILYAAAKSGLFHPIALALPLVAVRPMLHVGEFFHRKGEV